MYNIIQYISNIFNLLSYNFLLFLTISYYFLQFPIIPQSFYYFALFRQSLVPQKGPHGIHITLASLPSSSACFVERGSCATFQCSKIFFLHLQTTLLKCRLCASTHAATLTYVANTSNHIWSINCIVPKTVGNFTRCMPTLQRIWNAVRPKI